MKLIGERDMRFFAGIAIFVLIAWLGQMVLSSGNTGLILPFGIVSLVLMLVAAKISRVPKNH
ncbi:MAG: hypothetical protein AAGE65_10505 [Planctomycetota bacterium]